MSAPRVRRLRRRLLVGTGGFGWLYFVGLSLAHIIVGALDGDPPLWWLHDWHVHWAGARDLVERDLYHEALVLPGWPLPTPAFNLPPGSALIALPFLPLGRELGGITWLLLGFGCLVGASAAASHLLRLELAWAWIGMALLAYTGIPFFVGQIVLGNVNHIMLALLVAFAVTYLRGSERTAGILLGAAIAIKVWPVALAVLLVRERRWRTLTWAGGLVAVQGLAVLAWLGPDVLFPMTDALRIAIPYDQTSVVLWTTWARIALDAPAWLGPAAAVALLLIPARGPLGLGLGLLAGLSLINNVWSHYLPTFALSALLIGVGIAATRFHRTGKVRGAAGSVLRRSLNE